MAKMKIGDNEGKVLVDINSPYLLIMETNCTTCVDLGCGPFYTRDTSAEYFEPTNIDYSAYDFDNYITEGWEMNLWPV